MRFILLFLIIFTQTSTAGIHNDLLWSKYELTVCFAKKKDLMLPGFDLNIGSWNRNDMIKIRKWVQRDYSFEKTGINFIGFDDCRATKSPDLVIYYNQDSPILREVFKKSTPRGMSPIGMQPEGSIKGYPTARSYMIISTSGMKKRTVVHEFGHVAGLEHEHDHPQGFEVTPECPYVSKAAKYKANLRYSSYDKHSAMNYCTLQYAINNDIGLSPKDVELLKQMYP